MRIPICACNYTYYRSLIQWACVFEKKNNPRVERIVIFENFFQIHRFPHRPTPTQKTIIVLRRLHENFINSHQLLYSICSCPPPPRQLFITLLYLPL